MKNDTIVFGENLKMIRKKVGFTRQQLAEKISYSEKAVEKWESGSAIPPVATVCKLSELFGVTVDSLLYEPKVNVNYLLGIDGGGTKTEFLLTDLNKNEIARLCLGTSNPVDIGMDNAKAILEQGIRTVCTGINIRQVCAFAGLSGGTAGDNKEQINAFMTQFNFASYDNGNDVQNALEIALGGENGVAVIMGTGVISYAMMDGKQHRVSGWGPHVDKGGSGYNFGSDALDMAFKYADGRRGSKIINKLVEEKLGKPVMQSVPEIYRGGKCFVASFAPIVFEAYNMGDEMAAVIIDSNVKELAEILNSGLNFLGDRRSKIVICGSLVLQEEILMPYFKKHMGSEVNITFSRERMVDGAVMLAERLISN